ncbi:apolipoprotein N-acyltransferase [Opitutus sp. ER46]|uniref:apolipoprotein N-acyltransferase n=1 Tax=Opitutus sp. ER46 TaxID=2161864 RepID=UPI000D324BAC|nr:apolipoprotein N-acyltransferase [Opitutus sp. ER46]PTX92465.1 apolipoprotein N-acyltransferase [Opitutus sp. ER46]
MPPASDPAPTPSFDPYTPQPTFVQRHSAPLGAAAVFVLTLVFAVVAFPPFNAPEAAYAMLLPGVYWAYTRPSFRTFALTIGIAQMIAWTLILGWLHHVTWVGLFLLGPFVGLWVGSWYLAVWWAIPRMHGKATPTRLLVMLGLCGAWVLIEWTRTWFLGGFPWLPLAASQWQRPSILQIASLTGSYGVSFVLVAVNIGFAAYAHRLLREESTGFAKRSQEFFLALFLLMGCLAMFFQDAFGRLHYTETLGRIAFVQPDIPQNVKWDPTKAPEIVNVLRDTTGQAAKTLPSLIVWPEASTPWAVRGDESMKAFVESLAKDAKAPVLLGSIGIEEGGKPDARWYNGAFVVSPELGLQQTWYAKRHLVPFGEYVPLKPVLGWLRKVVPIGDDFTPGLDAAPVLVNLIDQPVLLGPLICYEDIYPQLARESVLSGASALTVLTNNGWFGQGGAAYQHAAHSVLRAVEFRRPVIRCGNAGWSGWIDEFGAIRAVLTKGRDGAIHTELKDAPEGTVYFRGTATVRVHRDKRWDSVQTFYARHGDWFVLVSAALVALGFGALRLGQVKPSPRRRRADA